MIKKILFTLLVVVIVAAVLFFALSGNARKDNGLRIIEAERGSIIDKALAVGKIEPKQEISVKSKISGIVRTIYVEVGDHGTGRYGHLMIFIPTPPHASRSP